MLGFQEYTYLAHLLGFSINRCQATLHFGRGSKDKSELSAGGGILGGTFCEAEPPGAAHLSRLQVNKSPVKDSHTPLA